MKIAHIVSTYPPYYGGMGNVVFQTVSRLADRGHNVEVLTPQYEVNKEEATDALRAQETYARELRPSIKFGNAARLPKIRSMLSEYDIVHLHYPFFGTAGLVYKWKKQNPHKKLVITYHMDTRAPGLKGLIFSLYARFYMPKILRAADALIASSFDYIESSDAFTLFKQHQDNAFELPFGVDLDVFAPREKPEALFLRHKLDIGKRTLLFVGGMDAAHYFKGIPVLLKSLYLLKKQKEDFQAVLVGDGELKKEFELEAQALGLSDSVVFVGRVGDAELPYYYNMADLFVLPSIHKAEAFGMVLLEAFASGVPVVASDLPGVRDVAVNAGVVVAPGSPVQLANRIQEFFSSGNNQSGWRVQARQAATERYDWNVVIEYLEDIYIKTLSTFHGKVIHGKALGRELGFPTANMDIPEKAVMFDPGVYAAKATVLGKTYAATLTIMRDPWAVEVYLINFPNSDIYGKLVEVKIHEKISDIKVCKSKEELQEKIFSDLRIAKDFFRKEGMDI